MTLAELIEQCMQTNSHLSSAHVPLVNADGSPFEVESLSIVTREDGTLYVAVRGPKSLQPGTYAIPESCTFRYANRKIMVVPKKTKDTSILRCGTCKYIKTGNKCCKDQYWETQYCELKPKTIGGKTEYFYHVSPSTKACDKYEEA